LQSAVPTGTATSGVGYYGSTAGGGRPPSPLRVRSNSQETPVQRRGDSVTTGPRLPPSNHRRVKSDIPLQEPPFTSPRHRTSNKPPPAHRRRRSLSANQYDSPLGPALPLSRVRSSSSSDVNKTGHHRRNSSFTGSILSAVTDSSMMTLVTDIEKSAFFGGYDDGTGVAQMNFPGSSIHMTMDETTLPTGHVFRVPIPDEAYEKYHSIADFGGLDIDENENDDFFLCNCNCNNCNGCAAKKELLPPNYYVLTIDDDLYKRMLDEVCSSAQMPCRLFFWGHHEDVSHPSVSIAAAVLTILFMAMGTVAYVLRPM
jgi:hypothetical protein